MNVALQDSLDCCRDRLYKHLPDVPNAEADRVIAADVSPQMEKPVLSVASEDMLTDVTPLFINQRAAVSLSAPSRNTMNA